MRRLGALLIAIAAATANLSAANAQGTGAPRARTAAELGLGVVGALGGTIAGSGVGALVARTVRKTPLPFHDDQVDPIILVAALTGNVLGSTWGVYAAGKMKETTESFGATLGGAAFGQIVGLIGYNIIMRKADGNDRAILPAWAVLWLSSPIVATIAFNLSRDVPTTVVPVEANSRRARGRRVPVFAYTIRF